VTGTPTGRWYRPSSRPTRSIVLARIDLLNERHGRSLRSPWAGGHPVRFAHSSADRVDPAGPRSSTRVAGAVPIRPQMSGRPGKSRDAVTTERGDRRGGSTTWRGACPAAWHVSQSRGLLHGYRVAKVFNCSEGSGLRKGVGWCRVRDIRARRVRTLCHPVRIRVIAAPVRDHRPTPAGRHS
jgi:hypothetical protein